MNSTDEAQAVADVAQPRRLPNAQLLRYLIKTYYEDPPRPDEEAWLSSHWKHYSDSFEVKTDRDGNLISLKGIAFGTAKWSSFLQRSVDQFCVATQLIEVPHRRDILRLRKIAAKVCGRMGLDPTGDVFRQVCSLDLMKRHLPMDTSGNRRAFLIIGDGYGVLSALVKELYPNSTIALVDIGKTLLFQAYYCQLAHPGFKHELASGNIDRENSGFVYCPAENLEYLERFEFDVAINIASMQEMNTRTIERYFAFLRRNLRPNNLFYCANREFKTLMGGEVNEFFLYPWSPADRHLVDGPCPWHRYYFAKSKSNNGLYLFGVRVPFVNFYDGTIWHRLSVLATE